jgi:hypothetical protein
MLKKLMYTKALKIVISPIIFNGSRFFIQGGCTRYNLTGSNKRQPAGINTKLKTIGPYQKQNRLVMFRKWSEGMAGRLISYNVLLKSMLFAEA